MSKFWATPSEKRVLNRPRTAEHENSRPRFAVNFRGRLSSASSSSASGASPSNRVGVQIPASALTTKSGGGLSRFIVGQSGAAATLAPWSGPSRRYSRMDEQDPQLIHILRIGHDTSWRGAGLSLRDALSRIRYGERRAGFDEATLLRLVRAHPAFVEDWLADPDGQAYQCGLVRS